MKNKKPRLPRLGIAGGMMWRVGVLVFAVWFMAMLLLTVIGATQLQRQWVEHANLMTFHEVPEVDCLMPGELEYRCINKMHAFEGTAGAYLDLPLYRDPMLRRNAKPEPFFSHETAVVFLKDGVPFITREEYLTFQYIWEENWFHDQETPDGYGYITSMSLQDQSVYSGMWNDATIYRLKGYFEGNQFVLTQLAGFTMQYPGLWEGKSLSQWDRERGLNWEIYYEASQPSHRETVCVYADGFETFVHENIFYDIAAPDQLEQILQDEWPQRHETYGIWETVVVREGNAVTPEGTHYQSYAVLRCFPLLTAISRLEPLYWVSLLIVVVMMMLLWGFLKHRLRYPLERIIHRGQQNMQPLGAASHRPKWKELYQLEEIYAQAQQELRTLRQENTQLKTTLDYAKNAEVSRRQLVSDMTHELKTPLAVIRSYCEGLLTGIAPEKREQYLNVIIEEADRMDATVLEMLDLSRLEAGKVRLSQDRVELLGLTKSILDKLQPLVEVKELSVSFAIAEESYLTADEGRLGQVITNLVSNAIKYSPMGGKVILRVFQHDGFTYFTSENESEPLSEEALEKIWDSFYRAEQSRSTEGTGLGLSICKAIIELHGGSCEATNTATGIEFRFAVPM